MEHSAGPHLAKRYCLALAVIAGFAVATSIAETLKIPLQKGLVLTTTTHAGLNTTEGSLPVADVETVYSVDEVTPDKVVFGYRIAAPGDPNAAAMLKNSPRFKRVVRTEDLKTSTRLNALYSSADPDLFAGQTFLETSAAVLAALTSSGQTPFVFGINESSGVVGNLASMAGLPPHPPPAAWSRDSRWMFPVSSHRWPLPATTTVARCSASSRVP